MKWQSMDKHEARRFKIAVGVVIACVSSVTFGFYCPPQYQETMVQPMFQSVKAALNEEIQAVDSSLSALMETYNQRLTSAVAVLTKQKAVVANQIADANRTAAETTAVALQAMSQQERVKAARFDYSGEFGQGYQPCRVYEERNLIANRDAELGEETRIRLMSEVNAAPGRYADPVQAQQAMAQQHRALFCTADQVASGMCDQVGPMAGASVNVATLFAPVMESEDLYKAKVAFVNNLAGLPDGPVPPTAANSPAALSYALAKAQKDALVSPALTSIKEVQLEHTGVSAAHGGSDIPMAMRMEQQVKRYLGNTPDYTAWTQVLAGQNSRGLLVEMLKIKALDLALMEKEYRQYERMEANLAALVSGEVRSQAARTSAAAENAAQQEAARKIK